MHKLQCKLLEPRAFLPAALQQESQLVTAVCSGAGRNARTSYV